MLAATNLTSLSSRRDDLSRNFFLSITNPTSCLHHLLPPPRSNAVTSRLRSYEIYPRPSTVQSDTVPSCNMAFLTTRTGLPYPSVSFYTFWRFQLLTAIIIFCYYFYTTRPTSVHTFLPFYHLVLILTELYQCI